MLQLQVCCLPEAASCILHILKPNASASARLLQVISTRCKSS